MSFEIEISGTNTPVAFGETLGVVYEVTNTGDTDDSQSVQLVVEKVE